MNDLYIFYIKNNKKKEKGKVIFKNNHFSS